jgi:bacterioferritin-associated ferredoxin
MTRCECSEVSFEKIAHMVADGCTHHEAMAATGAGHTCTACRGDLELYLATLNLI